MREFCLEILIEELSGKRKIARLLKKSPTATALQFSPLHVRVLEREREKLQNLKSL